MVAMDELPVQPDPEKHDADAPLARDQTSWYARELSEEWQVVEPGIYRYVGTRRGSLRRSRGERDRQASEEDG